MAHNRRWPPALVLREGFQTSDMRSPRPALVLRGFQTSNLRSPRPQALEQMYFDLGVLGDCLEGIRLRPVAAARADMGGLATLVFSDERLLIQSIEQVIHTYIARLTQLGDRSTLG